MQALDHSNPPFSLALAHNSYLRLPAYRESYLRRYHPYPRSRSSRVLEFDDVPMMTTHARYNGPSLDHHLPTIQEEGSDDTLASSPSTDDKARGRRLSLSALGGLLRQILERLRVVRKDEILFDMLT